MVKLYFIKNPASLKEFIRSARGSAILHVGDSVQFDLKHDAAGFEVLKRLKLGAENIGISFAEKGDRDRFVQYLITA